jgi:DNA-binding MarR family transcriptional regulator
MPGRSMKAMRKSKGHRAAISLGGLSDQIGYVLRRAQIAAFAHFNESLRSVELTPGKFSVLLLIGENPGIPQSTICGTLGILKSNLVAVVHELERGGHAERHAHGKDGRANELYLTPRGKALLRRAVKLNDAHERHLSATFKKTDRQKLVAMLKNLAKVEPGA